MISCGGKTEMSGEEKEKPKEKEKEKEEVLDANTFYKIYENDFAVFKSKYEGKKVTLENVFLYNSFDNRDGIRVLDLKPFYNSNLSSEQINLDLARKISKDFKEKYNVGLGNSADLGYATCFIKTKKNNMYAFGCFPQNGIRLKLGDPSTFSLETDGYSGVNFEMSCGSGEYKENGKYFAEYNICSKVVICKVSGTVKLSDKYMTIIDGKVEIVE